MPGHFWRIFASLVILLAFGTQVGQAGTTKAVSDKRTPADIAHSECSSQASGSKEVVLYGLTGGIVGFAFARERYMKDCMASRGYKYVPKKRKKIEYNR